VVILLNGAFGIGKTTVARLVARRLERTSIFDPELVGFVLQRAMRLTGRRVDDFQDLVLWRRLVVLGIRAVAAAQHNVIVPMAFSNVAYLREIEAGVRRFEPHVLHLCLIAPIEVVEERLERREGAAGLKDSWAYRRAVECCAAHSEAVFEEHIPAAGASASDVADLVIERVRRFTASSIAR
jgi:chloramphenicol 3-O-phosphotransferase